MKAAYGRFGLVLGFLLAVHAGCGSVPEATQNQVDLQGGPWSGTLYDNGSNPTKKGSGFNPLVHTEFLGQNLFHADFVGLNLENIFNGVVADNPRSMFTPRQDPCLIIVRAPNCAVIRWPAASSQWPIACEMRYTLSEDGSLDMEFKAKPTQACWGQGYVAFMWASYLNHARDRTIHFYGTDRGQEGWVTFGLDTPSFFEAGVVTRQDAPALPFEKDAQVGNVVEFSDKKFLLPFYYGLVDGDGDYATQDDTMAYVMMFDQGESIRFAMFNFISDADNKPNSHSPAWDWQYVIRSPQVGKQYGYRARLSYRHFTTPEDIKAGYERWVQTLPAP